MISRSPTPIWDASETVITDCPALVMAAASVPAGSASAANPHVPMAWMLFCGVAAVPPNVDPLDRSSSTDVYGKPGLGLAGRRKHAFSGMLTPPDENEVRHSRSWLSSHSRHGSALW